MSGNATTNAILDNARAALPGVADDVVLQTLFNVCDDLARESLRVPAPVSVDGDPATWLPSDQWVLNYQALLAGTLAALYGQPNKPYYNTDFAKFYGDRYNSYLILSRSTAAGSATAEGSWATRLVSAVRAQIYGVRDEAIELAMFAVVAEVRDEAYHYLAQSPDDPISSWLETTEFRDSYQAILYGTLAQLYGQANTAWYNLDQRTTQETLYRQELHQVRARVAAVATVSIHDRIIADVRIHIPLIRDGATELVMFGVINDIRDEAYRLPALVTDAASDTWLTTAQYEQSYLAILYGTLSRLFGQVGTTWYNLDQQKAQDALYRQELHQVRARAAALVVSTIPDRIVSEVRAHIPLIRDEATQLTMFGVVNDIRDEVYRLPGLASSAVITSWLTTAQYQQSYLAILYGTLSRLFGQVGTPWFAADQQTANLALYLQELNTVRIAEAGSSAATDSIVERLVSSIRAEIPYVRDEAINLAMFGAVDRLRAEVYRLAPLTGASTNPTSWFSTTQYEQAFLAIQHGTLYRLYAQAGQPWFSNELSQAQLQLYQAETISLRMVLAGAVEATDTIPERVVSAVRAQIQLVRDEAVKLEMFNVINKLRLEAYSLDALKGADTDYTTWLTEAQYEESYLVILHGTLCGLYGQSNMPWYNLDLYKAQLVLYQLELDLVRNENIDVAGGLDSLIDEVKPHLPGARDEILWIELRRCVDEFLKVTQVWEEDISLRVRTTKTIYEVETQSNSSIVRLISVANSSFIPVRATMLNIPTLVLEHAPDVKDTYTVTVALTLQGTGCCNSCGKSCTSCSCGNSLGFPNWIFDRWHEAFFDGLIGRMMLQPGKPYSGTIVTTGGRIASDPTSYHLKRFRSAMAEARSAARSQNIYAGQRWRFPAFA